jgi:hypothetical protein
MLYLETRRYIPNLEQRHFIFTRARVFLYLIYIYTRSCVRRVFLYRIAYISNNFSESSHFQNFLFKSATNFTNMEGINNFTPSPIVIDYIEISDSPMIDTRVYEEVPLNVHLMDTYTSPKKPMQLHEVKEKVLSSTDTPLCNRPDWSRKARLYRMRFKSRRMNKFLNDSN